MSKPGKWITLQDGGSDTWLEVRRVGKRAFQFIEVLDMHSATGDDHGDRYASEVALVDLDKLSADQIASARRYCGWDGAPSDDVVLAEMCWQYGCKAPLWSDGGTSRVRLHHAARSEARRLLDDDELAEAFDRPVNALGSTAAEYMTGDLSSAMQRGCEAGEPAARVMAKMYGAPQEVIDDTRPADWLPYFMGYMAAIAEQPKEVAPYMAEFDTTTQEELATSTLSAEYVRGYERGERVRKGEAPAPGWIKQPQDQVAITNEIVDEILAEEATPSASRSEPHVVSEGGTPEDAAYWEARNKL